MSAYDLLLSYSYTSNTSSPLEIINIPQTYTDLKIILNTRSVSDPLSAAWNAYTLDFNNTGLAKFEGIYFYTSGSGNVAVGAGVSVTAYMPSSSTTASTYGGTEIYIPNYSGTSAKKSGIMKYLVENNAAGALIGMETFSWNSTAAISSIQLSTAAPYVNAQTAAGSKIFIYGIKNS